MGESSPREQVRETYRALLDGNEESFVRRFVSDTSNEQQLVRQFYRSMRSAMLFRGGVVEAYGEEAWAVFESTDPLAEGVSAEVYAPTEAEFERVDSIDIESSNGALSVELFGSPVALRIVERNDLWVFDAASLVLPNMDAAATAEAFERGRSVLEQNMDAIGAPGVTPLKLNEKVGRGFLGM